MLDVSSSQADTSPPPSLNLMPLLDVMLLLLVFFLLASVFIRPALEVDLPRAAQREAAFGAERQLIIVVTESGEIWVHQTRVPLSQLQAHLEAALASDKSRPVVVRADQQSRFQSVVSVMDAVRGAGVEQVRIETRPWAPGTSP